MQVRAVVLALIVGTLIAGCCTAPGTYEFDPVTIINADSDPVWEWVTEFLAMSGLTIETSDRDSGLMVTSWMDASALTLPPEVDSSGDKLYCDCGGANERFWTRVKSTILLRPAVRGGTELTVKCVYQQRIHCGDPRRHFTVDCSSTGSLEHLVHAYVRAKAESKTLPPVPVFSPWSD